MSVNLTDPIFNNEEAARKHFEAIRWPEGPICPRCGVMGQTTLVKGKSHRPGMYQCNACREPFTVTVGSVMESSHVPLHKWALGFHLMASSKKGISANQLQRNLGLSSYRTAWFMAHRIREAMKPADAEPQKPTGGLGAIVEIDETYIGKRDDVPHRVKGYWTKNTVLTLVERGGSSRSSHVDGHTAAELTPYIRANVHRASIMVTDEGAWYNDAGKGFLSHQTVNHGDKKWKRGYAHTNTVEGFFSVFKRGMKGVYQHCAEKHLHRYLVEFDFRHSNRIALGVNDTERARRAVVGAAGRRLTYQRTGEARA